MRAHAEGIEARTGAGSSATEATAVSAAADSSISDIPDAAARRLTHYLHVLQGLLGTNGSRLSSTDLAEAAGVNSAILRKDLSHIGAGGVRGVGYDVAALAGKIANALGLERSRNVALAGAGSLARAIAEHPAIGQRGFAVVAVFDANTARHGEVVNGSAGPLPVRPTADIATQCPALLVEIGVIATDDAAAQDVCDNFVAAGIGLILNFTDTTLHAPDDVEVRPVDLALELQVLAVSGSRHAAERATRATSGKATARRTATGKIVPAKAAVDTTAAATADKTIAGRKRKVSAVS